MTLAPTIKLQTLAQMQSYADAGVHELHNNNDSPEINNAQKFIGLKVGSANEEGDPYCLAEAVWCWALAERAFDSAFDLTPDQIITRYRSTVAKQFKLTGSCGEMIDWAIAKNRWFPHAAIVQGSYTPVPGDWVFYDWNAGTGKKPARHVEILKVWHGVNLPFVTVGANVTPSSAAAEASNNPDRNGGIYVKPARELNRQVLGFIRMPDGRTRPA